MAPFLSLVCIISTLVSPNLGSGRSKEAPCFPEQLSMDLGCPYLDGGQKVVFVGKHSKSQASSLRELLHFPNAAVYGRILLYVEEP